jgi:hypothetical protein
VSATTTGFSEQQWSMDYLAFVGAPAASEADARVQFLVRWESLEDTFPRGNVFNPLDTELPEPGAGLWNRAGVRTYPTLDEGLKATLATMQQGYDQPILQALRSSSSTLESLTAALADSNWTGDGQRSPGEIGYASGVSGEPVGPLGPMGPGSSVATTPSAGAGRDPNPPATTLSIDGRLDNASNVAQGDVCVTAVTRRGPTMTAVTTTDGEFRFAGMADLTYRLEITDCRDVVGGVAPLYYDADAPPRFTTASRAAATVLRPACATTKPCTATRILRRPLVFGLASLPLTWPAPSSIPYGTALSASELDASSAEPGTFAYSPPPGTVLGVGSQTLAVTFTPAAAGVYAPATKAVALTVTRSAPTLSWAAPSPISFGTALGAAQLDASAPIPGTFSYSPPLGSVLPGGTATLKATFTPADSLDLLPATTEVALHVGPAPPTVTASPSSSVLPGSSLAAATIGAKSSVPGTFTYSPPLGSVLPAGPSTVTVTFTPANSADYSPVTRTVTVVTAPGTPRLTWATPRPVAAGTALTGAELDATASVPGTFSYSPPAGTVMSPGSQTLAVSFTPTNTTAYAPTSATVTLAVAPPTTPKIAWATPRPVAAGTVLSSAELDATASVPGTFVYSPPAGTVVTTGTETLQVSFTPTNTTGYTNASDAVTLAVAVATTTTLVVGTRSAPLLTWVTPGPVAEGTVLTTAELDATASVPGSFSYSPPAGTVVTAGATTLHVTFTPTNTTGYTTASDAVTLNVTPSSTTSTTSTTSPTTSTSTTSLPSTTTTTATTTTTTVVTARAAVLHPGATSPTV